MYYLFNNLLSLIELFLLVLNDVIRFKYFFTVSSWLVSSTVSSLICLLLARLIQAGAEFTVRKRSAITVPWAPTHSMNLWLRTFYLYFFAN